MPETDDVPALVARMEAYELDVPGAALPFTSRLAREQGWSHAQAARVVREYKRFAILAVSAGHPVSPSEAVDQAWHLHLVYTESYWRGMCRDVLGMELHHQPTLGGSQETGKFTDWYGKTLASYRRVFQEEPPLETWPPAAERFSKPSAGRWVDRVDWWLVPRPVWTHAWWWKLLFKRRGSV